MRMTPTPEIAVLLTVSESEGRGNEPSGEYRATVRGNTPDAWVWTGTFMVVFSLTRVNWQISVVGVGT